MRLRVLLSAAVLTASAFAQVQPTPQAVANNATYHNPYLASVAQLKQSPVIQAAFRRIDAQREPILREWVAITEINSPSGHEERRAQYLVGVLEQMGYRPTRDDAHNLIVERKGTDASLKPIVFDAHMDTVFQPGLQITARVQDGEIHAPGVGDDTRNVEAMLAMLRALDAAEVRTQATLVFLFTTSEETGLFGAQQYIEDHKDRIGGYVALDSGSEGFTYSGIGINWYRMHFIGPGGHTRSKTPPYSATLPLARAIQSIYALPVPERVDLNVGMLHGSDVENAKAADAWFSVDLRSTEQSDIDSLEKKISDIVKQEAEREKMQARIEVLSKLPASQVPANRHSRLADTAEAVFLAMGLKDIPITNTASNNSNEALLAGIPAISTGATPCEQSHSLTEYCEITPIYDGIKRVLLLGVAVAGISN